MIYVVISTCKHKVKRLTATYVFNECLLDATLHHTSSSDAVLTIEVAADDRCTNGLRGVDDLFNTWDTLCDTHASYTSEMESFQSHLRSRFAN